MKLHFKAAIYLLADLYNWKTTTIFSSLCSGNLLWYHFYININSALRCTVNQNPSVDIYWSIFKEDPFVNFFYQKSFFFMKYTVSKYIEMYMIIQRNYHQNWTISFIYRIKKNSKKQMYFYQKMPL